MNYSNSRFRIIFLGLAVLAQSLSAHNQSIDLIEWVSAHNNPSKELSIETIKKNNKTEKSQKKLSYIKKNVLYGIAGLVVLALAIYSYKYTLGLSLIHKPHDEEKNSEVDSADVSKNVPTLVEPSMESVVNEQLLVQENINQVKNIGFPDQASAGQDDIVPIQPIQQTTNDIQQVLQGELPHPNPIQIIQTSNPSSTVDSIQLQLDSTIKNGDSQVGFIVVEEKKDTVDDLIVKEIEQPKLVPVPVVDNKPETPEEKRKELKDLGLEQQVSDNNPHAVIESSENPVVSVLSDDESLIRKNIAELKWKDETTYEDWQEIRRLEKHLDELHKRKA